MGIFARGTGEKKEKAKKQDKDAVRHTHVNVFKVHRSPPLSLFPSFLLPSLPHASGLAMHDHSCDFRHVSSVPAARDQPGLPTVAHTALKRFLFSAPPKLQTGGGDCQGQEGPLKNGQ